MLASDCEVCSRGFCGVVYVPPMLRVGADSAASDDLPEARVAASRRTLSVRQAEMAPVQMRCLFLAATKSRGLIVATGRPHKRVGRAV
jgi:hypothetical protein